MQAQLLLVEHNPALRRSFAMTLDGAGYAVVQSADLREALDVARFNAPEVLVVDERAIREAPGTFRRLQRQRPLEGVLIVALSTGFQRRRQLIEIGVHAVVERPVTEHALLAAVRWVLDVYRLQETG